MSTELTIRRVVQGAEKSFELIDQSAVDFHKERVFAVQQLEKNEYIYKVALQNPQSAQQAITNIAAIGLSLNPALGLAYLVPRDGGICLDISYKGMIRIATDTGSIEWVQADIVYADDDFTYKGKFEKPIHDVKDAFGDRGDVAGVYCVAKTAEGDYLTEIMSVKEINEIRDCSMEFRKRGKNSIWGKWYNEQAKKSVIKRAYKTWALSEKHKPVNTAVHLDNVDYDMDAEPIDVTPEYITESQAADLIAKMEENGFDVREFCEFLEVESLSELPAKKLSLAFNAIIDKAEAA